MRIALATLGCKVNHYESAGIAEKLSGSGHEIVPFTGQADIYIVNTCSVTQKTDYQSRQLVRRAHRLNPSASIVVTGCYAQVAPETFRGLDGVTLVAGTAMKDALPSLLTSERLPAGTIVVTDMKDHQPFSCLPLSRIPGQTRGYVKIQDGCNADCSYCIIPRARGPSRSRKETGVIEEIRRFVDSGYREIVLTGIHLGHYGHDLAEATTLARLVRRIENETSIERIRLSSIEPKDVTNDLLALFRRSSRLCRHLHIPLQSGHDRILSLMSRNYTTADYRDLLSKIFDASPEAAVGIDIMTGFPGEGEKEFEATLEFVASLPAAYFHVFPWSSRPGTKAAGMGSHLKESVKKERARILRELGLKKREEYGRRFLGREVSVLVESGRHDGTGLLRGFSDTYIPVLVMDGTSSIINTIVMVTLESQRGTMLTGRVARHA
jgi:threonylcarbamoyladenosine tRNA methylthiotransferase MtaB